MESGKTDYDAVRDRRLEFNGSLGTDYSQRDHHVTKRRDLGCGGQFARGLDTNERNGNYSTSWSGT